MKGYSVEKLAAAVERKNLRSGAGPEMAACLSRRRGSARSADKYGNIQYNKPYWTIEKDGSMVLRDPYGNRISRKDGKVITDNQGIRNA